jgi:hypothetical protein
MFLPQAHIRAAPHQREWLEKPSAAPFSLLAQSHPKVGSNATKRLKRFVSTIFFYIFVPELKKTRERDLSIAENRQGLFSGGLPRKPLV